MRSDGGGREESVSLRKTAPQPGFDTATWDLREYDVLHLGCGLDQPADWFNVDIAPEVDPDAVHDLTETPWPSTTGHVERVVARHVLEHLDDPGAFFREAARYLVGGGRLEVTVPVGRDGEADPDHRTTWTWWTPKMFCRDHRERAGRPWDAETPFVLEERDLDVWLFGPFAPLSDAFNRAAQRWPVWGVRRCGAGELTAVYRRVER